MNEIKENNILQQDAKFKWVTLENGKHFKINPENGKILGGRHKGQKVGELYRDKRPVKANRLLDPQKSKTNFDAHKASLIKLTDAEKDAFSLYVHDHKPGAAYHVINSTFRKSFGENKAAEYSKEIELMDNAFKRASTTEQINVFRVIPENLVAQYEKAFYSMSNPSIKDDGYVSTTTSEINKKKWLNRDGKAVMEIVVPKGSPAISMNRIYKDTKVGNEQEILLNRGANFRIVNIIDGPPKRIQCEYINNKNYIPQYDSAETFTKEQVEMLISALLRWHELQIKKVENDQ